MLARDALPPPTEVESNSYATPKLAQWQQESSSRANKTVTNRSVNKDEETQAVESVFDVGHLIHDRLFRSMQTHNTADVLELLPRNLGASLLSTDAGRFIGWGIEIVEGPSWICTCLGQVPPAVPWMIACAFWSEGSTKFPGGPPSDRWQERSIHTGKPAIDIFMIAMGFSLLILALMKGSRMLESR